MSATDKFLIGIASLVVASVLLALTLLTAHWIAARQQWHARYDHPTQEQWEKWNSEDWGNWKVAHWDHPPECEEDNP
jgi:hypothetical protein